MLLAKDSIADSLYFWREVSQKSVKKFTLSVLEVVVWCEYAIVVVLMVVSGGGRVVLEVVHVP